MGIVKYCSCGSYDEILVVINSQDCYDTMVKPALVNVDCPIVQFTASAT